MRIHTPLKGGLGIRRATGFYFYYFIELIPSPVHPECFAKQKCIEGRATGILI